MLSWIIRSLMTLSILIVLWQMLIWWYDLPPYLLPSPRLVIFTLYNEIGLILHHALPTLCAMIIGFLLGVIFGGIAGCLVSFCKPLAYGLLPLLIISQAMPTFVIAPLLVMWLGFGLASKIMTTLIVVFFPMTSAIYDGLRKIPPPWLDLAQIMQASPLRRFWHIQLPAAMPAIASGVRLSAVAAPLGAIIGEWVGASEGLGYLMLNANARMQIDMMFAVLIVVIVFALLLYFTVDKLLNKWVWWTI